MDFNPKKLLDDAGTFLSRAVQMTEELVYSSSVEKSTVDPLVEAKCKQADGVKGYTERIVKDTEAVLTPNPGYRVEDFLMEKIDKKRPQRMSNLECLGQGLIDAGNEFGANTSAYGSMLLKVGANELKLGQTERDFISSSVVNWIEPLNRFMDNEVRNLTKARKLLENKRLDLDAAKNKLRKAREMAGSGAAGSKQAVDPRVLIQQAEREVMQAGKEFQEEQDSVRVQLEVTMAARDRHVDNLKCFVQAQTTFYARCHQIMQDLNKDLDMMPLHSVNLSQSFSVDECGQEDELLGEDSIPKGPNNKKKVEAKVMFDYVAKSSDQISVFANEMILVEEDTVDNDSSEFCMAYKGSASSACQARGRVPKSCILLI